MIVGDTLNTLFGSLLDSKNVIKRRNVVAINATNKLKQLFLNKDVTLM